MWHEGKFFVFQSDVFESDNFIENQCNCMKLHEGKTAFSLTIYIWINFALKFHVKTHDNIEQKRENV